MISPMPRSSTSYGISQPVWPVGRDPDADAGAVTVTPSRRVSISDSGRVGEVRRSQSAGRPRLSEGFGGGYSPAQALALSRRDSTADCLPTRDDFDGPVVGRRCTRVTVCPQETMTECAEKA